jgi:hypothetical protein
MILEVMFFPCICGHERRDHVIRNCESDGLQSSYFGGCQHDRAYYSGMCLCSGYTQMTNLQYLEWKYEKSL